MIKVYKKTDLIPIKVESIKIHVSPLSWGEKQDILTEAKMADGEVSEDNRNSTYKSLKYSVKKVEGIEYADGTPFKVELDDNGYMSDEQVEELLNIEVSPKIIMACYNLVQGIPSKIVNPLTGEPVEGVKIMGKSKGK